MAISRSRGLRKRALLGLSGSQNQATTARAMVGKPIGGFCELEFPGDWWVAYLQ
jgi:hypothetical protein